MNRPYPIDARVLDPSKSYAIEIAIVKASHSFAFHQMRPSTAWRYTQVRLLVVINIFSTQPNNDSVILTSWQYGSHT